ncbi:hypothetical protein RND71_030221 [Anisodus tanguticus]|uniref:Uncharacterized protein n=1 Tax=Anisodus tanguticus TaxID=243964 RepID=A0AAE1RFZ7_9SOLA|nr:hypothetical protein RND71_030221 [Anisodus tanguticus]
MVIRKLANSVSSHSLFITGTFMTGSENNDEVFVDEHDQIRTKTNRSGGVIPEETDSGTQKSTGVQRTEVNLIADLVMLLLTYVADLLLTDVAGLLLKIAKDMDMLATAN